MIPVLSPEEMAQVDQAAPVPVEVLVGRAGAAVAASVLQLLRERTGGTYGRRVVVVAGRGNNGADGRAAATMLRDRGVAVRVLEAADVGAGAPLRPADVVVDAAYGTGLSRPYHRPDPGPAAVVAVDIASGLSGTTGAAVLPPGEEGQGAAVRADVTVTMAAYKPGLLLGDGPEHCGAVHLAGIGLGGLAADVARAWLVTDHDVAHGVPPRARDTHKWTSAVQVVAGSPGMAGAPWMVSRAAMRSGAGYVRLGIPGMSPTESGLPPGELVGIDLPLDGWPEVVAEGIDRVRALVVGPGLGAAGRGPGGVGERSLVARVLRAAPDIPAVVDADGLNALGDFDVVAGVVGARRAPTVLTPHAGEYARLAGGPPSPDRLAAVRDAARRSGAVVLLKGSVTVVADPDGTVLLAAAGSSRLATAGTGDVLSGVIGAFLARGVSALQAAALAAHTHGRAASLGLAEGLVASDLPDLVARWLSQVLPAPPGPLSTPGP